MYYADLSKPFSPTMIRRYRRDGETVVYVHPVGGLSASIVAHHCGLPEAAELDKPPGGAEPLPQFEKPLPTSWRHMLPGPARDAVVAVEVNPGHRVSGARRRGAGTRKNS